MSERFNLLPDSATQTNYLTTAMLIAILIGIRVLIALFACWLFIDSFLLFRKLDRNLMLATVVALWFYSNFALPELSAAALATYVGGMLRYLFPKNSSETVRSIIVGFTAGVMITVSVLDLIPEGIEVFDGYVATFLTIIGTLIYVLFSKIMTDDDLSFLAITAHNVPEGFAIALAGQTHSVGMALVLHNLPEGFLVVDPARDDAYIRLLVCTLSEPLAGVIGMQIFRPWISEEFIASSLTIVAGIMIAVSVHELRDVEKLLASSYGFAVGAAIMAYSII